MIDKNIPQVNSPDDGPFPEKFEIETVAEAIEAEEVVEILAPEPEIEEPKTKKSK